MGSGCCKSNNSDPSNYVTDILVYSDEDKGDNLDLEDTSNKDLIFRKRCEILKSSNELVNVIFVFLLLESI